jgi:hypothetical protein
MVIRPDGKPGEHQGIAPNRTLDGTSHDVREPRLGEDDANREIK